MRFFGPTSELPSEMQNNAQYHDLVPLDGKYKRGRACIGLSILLALEEVSWCRSTSFQVTLEINLHTSLESDRYVSLESVVEVIVDFVETGADNPDFEQHSSWA